MAIKECIKISRANIFFVVLFLTAALFLRLWQLRAPTATLIFKDETLHVLVARTDAELVRGLGRRDSLAPYDGMLFIFAEPAPYAFVMREMRFPIDIIWFLDGKVVDMAPNVQLDDVPEEALRRYVPRGPATLVLELPAGWVAKRGVKIGDALNVSDD